MTTDEINDLIKDACNDGKIDVENPIAASVIKVTGK